MKNDKQGTSKVRILNTAVRIFARKGYADTGMRELADGAEVNLAMINYFFGSKKELLKVILETFFTGYLKVIEDELTGPGTFDEKISRFIHRAINYISENRDYMIVTLAELPHDDPEITEYKAQWARKAMYVVPTKSVPLSKNLKELTLSCGDWPSAHWHDELAILIRPDYGEGKSTGIWRGLFQQVPGNYSRNFS